MLTRHLLNLLTAAAVICVLVPAHAQDTSVQTASGVSAVKATAAYPVRQDFSQLLGSNLIGAKVMSVSNEAVGKVSNLVVNDEGAIESVVIALTGLFGLTAKNVAVTYKSLAIVRTKAGDAIDHVTLAATKNDLTAAAEFRSLSEQKTERHARRSQAAPVTPTKLTSP